MHASIYVYALHKRRASASDAHYAPDMRFRENHKNAASCAIQTYDIYATQSYVVYAEYHSGREYNVICITQAARCDMLRSLSCEHAVSQYCMLVDMCLRTRGNVKRACALNVEDGKRVYNVCVRNVLTRREPLIYIMLMNDAVLLVVVVGSSSSSNSSDCANSISRTLQSICSET